MHIRAFIGAAVLAFCTLAIVPAVTAMGHSPPDICVLDLSAPPALDFTAAVAAGGDCLAINADIHVAPTSLGGDQGEAAPALCVTVKQNALDFASYRLHVDPGRCSA